MNEENWIETTENEEEFEETDEKICDRRIGNAADNTRGMKSRSKRKGGTERSQRES